jgi:hypothetical protein
LDTSEIKELINTRNRLKRKAILTNLENDWLNFKTARNKVKYRVKECQKRLLFLENSWSKIQS